MTAPHSFHLKTVDGLQLAAREWRPTNTAEHHVLVVHGLGEHLGRYDYLGESFAAAGIRCVGVDLRGHGLSKGRRGHIWSWQDYVHDIAAVAELLPARFSLLGHSMGGLIALDYLHQQPERVSHLVLSGPLVGEAVKNPAWKKRMGSMLSHVLPWLPIDNGIPMEDLCTDEAAVALFEGDSLRVQNITPRWYTEMLRAIAHLWQVLPQYQTPLQLHVAGEERIIDRDALERFYRQWPAAKQRWVWEGGRHEILHEPFREGVVAAMLEGIRG